MYMWCVEVIHTVDCTYKYMLTDGLLLHVNFIHETLLMYMCIMTQVKLGEKRRVVGDADLRTPLHVQG